MPQRSRNTTQNNKRRAEKQAAALMRAMGASPIRYLIERFVELEKGKEKDEHAWKLVEYEVPRLRSIDVEASGVQNVVIQIGGVAEPTQLGEEVAQDTELIEGEVIQ